MNFTIEIYRRNTDKTTFISTDIELCRDFLREATSEKVVRQCIENLEAQQKFSNSLLFLDEIGDLVRIPDFKEKTEKFALLFGEVRVFFRQKWRMFLRGWNWIFSPILFAPGVEIKVGNSNGKILDSWRMRNKPCHNGCSMRFLVKFDWGNRICCERILKLER